MDFLICGSAAAEGWPALFCNCRCCLEARRRSGKDIRSRTTYQLGDTVRIDFGPDSFHQMARFGLPFERLRHLLVTHSHQDHWLPSELYFRRPGFSAVDEKNILSVYGNSRVREKLEQVLGEDFAFYRIAFHEVRPGRPIPLEAGITATAFPAAHDRGEMCVFYAFQVGDKTLLQANDTGWFDEPTWEMLRAFRFDAVVMDCTYGGNRSRHAHLGAPDLVEVRDRMRAEGMLKPECRFVANHFTHNCGWMHDELEAYLGPKGIETGYDGMRIPV